MIVNRHHWMKTGYNKWDSLNTIKYFLRRNKGYVSKYVYTIPEDIDFFDKELTKADYSKYSSDGRKTKYTEISHNYQVIGISEDGSIVTIPKLKESANVNIFGVKGSGKSLLYNLLLSNFFNLFHYHCICINDQQNETGIWTLPTITPAFRRQLDFLNMKGCPLPILTLIPTLKNSQIKLHFPNMPHLNIKISWEDFVEKIHLFIDLGPSAKYFQHIREPLKKCSSKEEVMVMLDNELDKKIKGTRIMLLALIGNIFDDEIINFDKDSISELKDMKRGITENAVISLLRNDLFPVLLTEELRTKGYIFSGYLNYLLTALERKQVDSYDEDFDKHLIIGCDEINLLLQTEEGTKDNVGLLKKTFNRLALSGRLKKMSLVCCGQSFSDKNLDDKLKNEAKYTYGFQSIGEDAKALKRRLNLNRAQGKDLETLPKFVCYAKTEVENGFILFSDAKNPRKTMGPIKMHTIPSLAQHQGPNTIKAIRIGENLIHDYKLSEYGRYTSFTRQYARIKNIKLNNPSTNENILKDFSYRTDIKTYPLKELPVPNIPRCYRSLNYLEAFFGKQNVGSMVIDYKRIYDLGYRIITKSCKPSEQSYKGQQFVYTIKHIDELSNLKTKYTSLDNKPNAVKEIIYDKKNKELWLHGKDCSTRRFKINI